MLLLFVWILRRERLALIPLWLLILALSMLVMQASLMMIPLVALYSIIFIFVLYRYGLLALAFALFVNHLWVFFPLTSDFTAWYATDFVISLVICIALAVYGFYTSLGGQPVFKGGLLQE